MFESRAEKIRKKREELGVERTGLPSSDAAIASESAETAEAAEATETTEATAVKYAAVNKAGNLSGYSGSADPAELAAYVNALSHTNCFRADFFPRRDTPKNINTPNEFPKSAEDEKAAAARIKRYRELLAEKVAGNVASEYEKLEFLLLPYFKEPPEAFAKKLLRAFGSLRAVLFASPEELRQIAGMPSLAALTIPQYAAMLYGANSAAPGYKGKIDSPEKAAKLLAKWLGYGKKERFYVLHLDKNNRLITAKQVAEGNFSKVTISTAYLVAEAIAVGAHSVIMAHNHPNNAPFPSEADISTTKSFSEAYYSVGINLLDHIIIAGVAPNAFYSLARGERSLENYFDVVDGYRFW